MRGKKILACMMSVFMLCVSLCLWGGGMAHAEENVVTDADLDYDFLVNGEDYRVNSGLYFFEKGSEISMSVENVIVKGQPAEEVSYQWSKQEADSYFENVDGANSSEYSFEFQGEVAYSCTVTVGEISTSTSVIFKEDTLTVSLSSTPTGEMDEWGDYQIADIAQGQNVTLNVDARSSLTNGTVTYQWSCGTLWTEGMDEIIEGATGSSYTLTKGVGIERYTCEVSDGNRTEYMYFVVNPQDTLETAPTINDVTPEPFERGYLYVARPGEEVTMRINAKSSNDDVTYRWVKKSWENGIPETVEMGSSDSLTVTKGKGESEDHAEENYFCYVDDGNEHIEVMIILFGLHPYQVTTETVVQDGAPEIAINNEVEELSNYLLKEDLDYLNGGSKATIKLTAESKEELDDSEKAIIENKLADDSNIGMYLDLNLYKNVEGKNAEQITETGTAVNLSVDIPAELQVTDSRTERTYQLVRIHDGEAETLKCEYDSESGKLTFDTDRFSTYAVAYTDSDSKKDDSEISSGNEPSKDTPDSVLTKPVDQPDKSVETAGNTSSIKTGDNSIMLLWAVLILISCCVLAGVHYKKRCR